MSAVTPTAVPPSATILLTASATGPWLRATIATAQPSSASIFAAIRPMPLLPPVKRTTLPAMPRSTAASSLLGSARLTGCRDDDPARDIDDANALKRKTHVVTRCPVHAG